VTQLVVTGTAEVGGRVVTGSAVAEVAGRRPPCRAGEVRADTRYLLALADLVERHAREFRRDLERLAAGGEDDGGFDWFGPEPAGM
jgi:hypothetical protein